MKPITNQTCYNLTIFGVLHSGSKHQAFQLPAGARVDLWQLTRVSCTDPKFTFVLPPVYYDKVVVRLHEEASNAPDMVVYDLFLNGKKIRSIPEIDEDESRKITFMATGDPQFDKNNKDHNYVADKIMERMWAKVYNHPETYYGQLIAGDLTHLSIQKEWKTYRKIADRMEIYDCWGNHDIKNDWIGWFVKPGDRDAWKDILEHISGKIRRFPCNRHSDPLKAHYSWDWRDVHFVNVNLFPGDTKDVTGNIHDPKDSLTFLKEDLAKHVGASGRPVVIMQHYGHDDLSIGKKDGVIPEGGGDWTEEHRALYWDAIADYRVVLIISGHVHNHRDGYVYFERPAGKTNGPDKILNLIPAAAHLGYFMEIEIGEDRVQAKRYLDNYDDKVFNKMWEYSWTFPTGYKSWVRNIQIVDGLSSNRSMLSCTWDGLLVDLWSEDDRTGRQQWRIRPIEGKEGFYHILNIDGVSTDRRYLSCSANGRKIDLAPRDYGNGRQQWKIEPIPGKRDLYHITIERGLSTDHKYLSCTSNGQTVDLWIRDDDSGRQQWCIRDFMREEPVAD